MKDISMFILGLGFLKLYFFDIVFVLYFSQVLGSAANGMLLWTIYKGMRFVFEVPTGWIADVFGRTNTMVLSCLSLMTGMVLYYFAYDWATMTIASLFLAFGFSSVDGTKEAFLYEILKCSKNENNFSKIESYCRGVMSLTSGVASVVGGILAVMYSYRLVFFISAIPIFFSMLIFLTLKDPKRSCAKKSERKGLMWKSLKELVKNKKTRYLAFGKWCHNAESVLRNDALPVFLKTFVPLNLISVFWGIREVFKSLLCIVVWRFSEKPKNQKVDKVKLQISIALISLFSVLAVLLKMPFLSMSLVLLTVFPVLLSITITSRIFQTEFKSKQRAEEASWVSTGKQMSQLLMGVVLSLMLRFCDIQTTFLILTAVICVLNIYFYGKAFRKKVGNR